MRYDPKHIIPTRSVTIFIGIVSANLEKIFLFRSLLIFPVFTDVFLSQEQWVSMLNTLFLELCKRLNFAPVRVFTNRSFTVRKYNKVKTLHMETNQRKSHTSLSKIYFWTATIHNWLPLLTADNNKQVIINSLKTLSDKKLITVYAFVIMPNHIHLIWQQNELNGKETPKGSLLK